MKAIRLFGKEQVRLEQIEIPSITKDELLVKVKAASLCGTDVRMYQNGVGGVDEKNPLILGHEFAGDIVKVGENITTYKVGQKVALAPNIGCGMCDLCVSGQSHLCGTYDAFGVTMDGGFAEYVKIPANAITQGNIAVLDEEISYQEAALVEPLSCVYNGQKLLNMKPGSDVLIIGMGPIGLMHIMVAKVFGAGKIFVNDLSQDRLDKAVELFPDVTPITGDVLEGLKMSGVEGVDVCIIAAPAAQAQSQSLYYMNMNGKLLFFGGLPKDRENVSINTNIVHYKQLTIQGCTKQSVFDYRLCAKLVNDKRIPLGLIMSDTYTIEEFDIALENAAKAIGLKHVIAFD